MKNSASFHEIILRHEPAKMMSFDPEKDRICFLNLTAQNPTLSFEIISDTNRFIDWINNQLNTTNSKFGVGGYNELRTIYSNNIHFTSGVEPRSLHLGVDVWGNSGNPIFAPYDGVVHSFKFNDIDGDYGATLILQHQLDGLKFYTLYGHLSLSSIQNIYENQAIKQGQEFAWLGQPHENGNWPPHLHFQVILDMEGMFGDYPGVCRYSERKKYLNNCPDPNLLLRKSFI